MKLARFIQTEREQLLKDFGEAALEIAPELRGEDSRAREDHAREMLEFITEDLLTPQANRESARKALGKARSPISKAADQHGTGRHSQGLSMVQMIQELRALRARVMQVWGDSQQGLSTNDIDELLRFNEAIDHLIVNSVASYSDLKEQETHLFEAMLRVSPDPSAIFDPGGKFLFLNTPMADMANITIADAVGNTPLELALGFATKLHDAIAATVATGQFQRKEFHYTSPSGQELYFDCQLVPVFDDQNEIKAVAKTSRDITERKQAERQVWRSANFDSLTGIPNRRLFLDRLEQSLQEAKRHDCSFALLFIDLDRFKQANDELGHKAGDLLLEQVAERISTNVRAMDTVARLGGDEFTLIFKDITRENAKKAAKVLLGSLERSFYVEAHEVYLSGSIGLALYPEDGTDADQLMHNADQAMYAAKERGGHQVLLHQDLGGAEQSFDRTLVD
ncbi:sensor domain-containing diguanylate cyclase [Vreelandella arcis]|uniref:PAS domain S-box-containing protein/diguanylate cyclase (GGDEF) domain-containing protein n=1 Tax=Vreelandella arcis TaxID=416873 RepID=A0A1G9YK40_9GAMM|nr:sensor domain-containing diguanylate cyclase [Halomonas arcis]SDN08846.1 PAS domain S-box-containing protein/diguanylate cyclase (GGDEF) domain-containing protein [Halomonas arcis]